MTRRLLTTLSSATVLAAASGFLGGSPASATTGDPSTGCRIMNTTTAYDGYYYNASLDAAYGYPFAVGERIVMTASSPATSGSLTATLQIRGTSTTTLTSVLPASFDYTLTEDLDSSGEGITWFVGNSPSDRATWTVECIPYTAPSPSPAVEEAPPMDHLQQVDRTTDCASVDETTLTWGSTIRGGWSESWAQWPNSGRGGSVCTRTIGYRQGTWQVVD